MARTAETVKAGTGFERRVWIFATGLVMAQAVLLAWNLERGYHRTLAIEDARLADAAHIADENISGSLRAIDLLLRDVGAEFDRRGAKVDPAAMSAYMTTRARAFPEIRTVQVTDPRGVIVASTRADLLGKDVHDRPYYRQVFDTADRDRTVFSPLIRAQPTNVDVVFSARALPYHDGQPTGLVFASLEIGMFHALLLSLRPSEAGSVITIIGKEGRIISRQPDPERYVGVDVSNGAYFTSHRASGQRLTFHQFVTITDNIEKIGAIRTVADGSFVVIVTTPIVEALAPWWAEVIHQGLTCLVVSIALLLLTGLAIRYYRREVYAKGLVEQAQDARRQSDERLALAVAGAHIGIWDYDVTADSCVYNTEMMRLYGLEGDGRGFTFEMWRGSVHTEDREGAAEEVRAALWEERPLDTEFRIVRPDGTIRHVRSQAQVYRDEDNAPRRMVGLNVDVTERREMIENLRNAKEAAERASQAKSIFLSSMTHELRTPLNSIIGFTEFVLTQTFGPVGDRQYLEHGEYARESAHHLLDIINDILDFSKIEAGIMKLEPVRLPVAPIVKRSVAMVHNLAFGAGVTINASIPAGIPPLWADERAMCQILVNLLGNAVKFNVAGGSVLVTAAEAGKFVDIVVADTGIGIPTEAIGRVRKPFEQLNNQYSRAHGGTGLGLSIVEGLAGLHGGALIIASAVGKGTAMTVRIPTAGCGNENESDVQ